MGGPSPAKRRKGFRPKSRTYELRWAEDHELHGLVVTARAMRMGQLVEMASLFELIQQDEDAPTERAAAQVQAMDNLMVMFGKTLVEWNREDDDGELLDCSADGLREMEDWEFMALIEAYMEAAVGVSDPLSGSSSSGEKFPVELPPMDEL